MTTLGIRYLTGYSVATSVTREGPEWPPHPGRVFMAMAAAYFETGGDPNERKALEWLEGQDMPTIQASDCHERDRVGVYVPVNDEPSLPRRKQERVFPTVRPERDTVLLTWEADAPQDVRKALDALCSKVTRIGHSSSLAQMWIADDASHPNDQQTWWPEDKGGLTLGTDRLRVATPGSLNHLAAEFNLESRQAYADMADALESASGKDKTKLKKHITEAFPEGEPALRRPKLARWVGYGRRLEEPVAGSVPAKGLFDSAGVIVFEQVSGERLGLESTQQLTGALRNVAMHAAGQDVPEWLSGHTPDGTPTKLPHAAFFPLPFVGSDYADGHLMGMAMAIPRGVEKRADFRRVMGSLLFNEEGDEREIRLWKNHTKTKEKVWQWTIRRSSGPASKAGLRIQNWAKASRLWASVTPIVLHHYPKKNRPDDVADIVKEAVISAGLPEPSRVAVQPVSPFRGAGHVRNVPEFSEGGEHLCRYQTHALIEFQSPVEGPVLVGRGRFRGYGLCKPMGREEDARPETD